MVIAADLLKARHIGIRELKGHLSQRLKEKAPLIVTDHGTPTKVILSYQDILELVDILDELQDRQALRFVEEGRMAVRRGSKGIPVSELFEQIRASRK